LILGNIVSFRKHHDAHLKTQAIQLFFYK